MGEIWESADINLRGITVARRASPRNDNPAADLRALACERDGIN